MEVDVIVDLKNGFIEIIDEGIGGGIYYVQVVFFCLANGKFMIVVSKKVYDGFSVIQEYYFFCLEYFDQYDWIEYMLGVLFVFDFLELDYVEDLKILEEVLLVLLDLLQ